MFAEVILPLAIPGTFSYIVPPFLTTKIQCGVRVLVSFGIGKKLYAGIVYSVSEAYHNNIPVSALSSIIQVLDEEPIIPHNTVLLLEWIAEYYCCTLGEAVRAALPTGLSVESLTYVQRGEVVPEEITMPFDPEQSLFPQESAKYNSALAQCYQLLLKSEPRNSVEFAEIIGNQNYKKQLREWAEAGFMQLVEEPAFRYKPKIRYLVSLAPQLTDLELISTILDTIRGPKQEKVLKVLYQAFIKNKILTISQVCEQANCSESVIKSLVEKQWVVLKPETVSRLSEIEAQEPNYKLQKDQETAVSLIQDSWEKYPAKPVLLVGVTGSGKTYVYMELIREQIQAGKQCLYILPEISLTEHIVTKLKQHFGNQMLVYHSRMRSAEKVEIWNSVKTGDFPIVVGVRSSIFLPFQNLGLVVIDEEHDSSLKQQEDAPRYHGRDSALMLSKIWGGRAILGSATPSLESYQAAINQQYTMVHLPRKAINLQPVVWKIVDMRHQIQHKLSVGIFSSTLIEAIQEAIQKKEQVILFLNRRGYAPVIQCNVCGYVPVCPHCDVSLTGHLHNYQIICHYCGYSNPYSQRCPKCQASALNDLGYGTERVEVHLQELFPQIRIARMDSDSITNTLDLNNLMRRFSAQEVDILIGTQMVTKGLDFENVTVAGILDADRLLFQPDFRAQESTYSLITQLAGRTGRHQKNGTIFIQTKCPDNSIFEILTKPITIFLSAELQIRKNYFYPPFARLIRIELKHKNAEILLKAVTALQSILNQTFGGFILGPTTPAIPRIQDHYRQYFLLKIPKDISPKIPKQNLTQLLTDFYAKNKDSTLRIIIDVDPR